MDEEYSHEEGSESERSDVTGATALRGPDRDKKVIREKRYHWGVTHEEKPRLPNSKQWIKNSQKLYTILVDEEPVLNESDVEINTMLDKQKEENGES